MGKKKHKKKKKEAEQRSILQTPSREIFSSEAINQAAERIIQIRNALGTAIGTIDRKSVSLPLGGGTVRTARITSKGISFCGRRHYNSDYIQTFCGREVLIHEVGGKMKAYLYDETSKLLMRIICEVDISQVEMGNLVDGLSGSEASGRYSNW